MIKILQLKDNEKILRSISKKVPPEDITSPTVQKVIQDMQKALHSQEDGVAISAVQIGTLMRIFIISGTAFDLIHDTEEGVYPDSIFINPVITSTSKDKQWLEEGCLSIRGIYGEVERSEKVKIEALNEKGEKVSRGGSGLLAQIFQHESDHLDGILFIDKARNLYDNN